MELNVKSIHLTAKSEDQSNFDPKTGNTDVIVFLEDGILLHFLPIKILMICGFSTNSTETF
jgi:hypothetical protein